MKAVIIGGVAGGATAAARLRRLDEGASITIYERSGFISYANCGLPYYIGGEIADDGELTLQTPSSFKERFNVDVYVRHEVTAIDAAAREVEVRDLATGRSFKDCYDKLIIATGAKPALFGIEGAGTSGVFTLRTVEDTLAIKQFIVQNKPRTAIIAGGGYIGIELAENLVRAGIAVTILQRPDRLLQPLDYDMACLVAAKVRQAGAEVVFGASVKAFESRPQGGVLCRLADGSARPCDMAVAALGVQPDSALAAAAGLKMGIKGAICVDEHMRTSSPDIYAVGDVVQVTNFVTGGDALISLAGPANKQGRIAADNICGIPSRYTGTQGSSILKVFDLAVASTGITEKTAKALHLNYEKSFTFSANHATYYPGATNMSIKTIFEKNTGKILGVQIVGNDGVDKRCDVFATAIRAGMTAKDLTELELCYAPPFGSAKDPVNMAGYVIENMMSGLVKTFHWHDIEKISKDPNAFLLDTRNPMEYLAGTIPGFVNIPLDSLRDRLDEIPKDKTIYVTCQIGLRGYIAARILMQNGYDVYNLSGGYRLYQTIFG